MSASSPVPPAPPPQGAASRRGLAFVDRSLVVAAADEALAAWAGRPADELRGRPLGEALPAWAPTLAPLIGEVLATGAPALDIALPPHPLAPGGPRPPCRASCYPLRAIGGYVAGVDLVVRAEGAPAAEPDTVPWHEVAAGLDLMPVGLVLLDGADLRVRWANAVYQTFLDATFQAGTLAGRRLHEFIPRAEESGVAAVFRQVAATGRPYINPEYRHDGFARGPTFWRWTLLPVARPGAPADLLLVVTEVTEQVGLRHEAEALARALRAERAQLAALIEQLPVGLYVAEAPSGRLLMHNAAAVRMLGHPLMPTDDMGGYSQYGALHPDGRPYAAEDHPLARALRGEVILADRLTYRRGDGALTRLEVSAAPIRDADGRIALAVSTFHDVSEHERLQAQIQQQARLLDQSYEPMVAWELGAGITAWNRGAEVLYGFASAEALGRAPHELLRTVYPAGLPAFEAELLATGQWQGELQHITRDGRAIVVECRATLIVGADGRRLVLEANRDVTRRKLAEQTLRASEAQLAALAREQQQLYEEEQRARAAAEAAVRLREEFLSIASHELRTPLTSVIAHAQTFQRRALRDATLGERDRRSLEQIIAHAGRLNRMIEIMLDVSRIDQGRLQVEPAPLDLAALVREVVAGLDGLWPRHTIVITGDEVALWVAGDALRLEQVLHNLLSNAIKYSPRGGAVAVALAADAAAVRVTISDHGIGIPRQDVPRIFERFYRAGNVSADTLTGVGIGLYVVREIVALHGGTIAVASEEGVGSSFTITLPLIPAPQT
ncbi:MAG TPA: PAS domain-containing protein [Chloroflexaceae bacterium]|nr:PAS domain-containing protein [Chloroflexaceae bacterium]